MKQSIKTKTQNRVYGFLAILATLPGQCFAAGSALTPTAIIQNIIDFLTGDLARVVGVLVVAVAGYMHLETEHVSRKVFVRIFIGMSLILGAPTLAALWWGY